MAKIDKETHRAYKTLINEIGYERFLFGTDYPFVASIFYFIGVTEFFYIFLMYCFNWS